MKNLTSMVELRSALINRNAETLKKQIETIKENINNNNITWWTEQYLTTLRLNQFKKGEISADKLIDIAIKKAIKKAEKNIELQLAKIDEIENAETFENLTIAVDWKKSQTWGSNPMATMTDEKNRYFSERVSGCGYDKESTAIASVLNQYLPLLKLLCELKNNSIDKNNHEIFGYGSGYNLIPSFEGGVGTSAFYKIFETLGYKMTKISSGNNFDVYTVTKL